MDGSTLQGKETWEGRDFFGGHLCELGLFLCPFKEERSINHPIIKSMFVRDNSIIKNKVDEILPFIIPE